LAKYLFIVCTNLSSFSYIFGEDPLIEHNNKFYVCCFDNGQNICIKTISKGAIGISFNNILQKKMWDKRNSGIPSYVIPYGVNELPYIENSIKISEPNKAIWIGAFRRKDMVERLVQFANVNPDCKVDVVTRKIFDQETLNGYGSLHEPYADFNNGDPHVKFYSIFKDISGFCPRNIQYLGMLEGENHVVLGSHSIGIDFGRFPAQQHDNTKILDYLRSGLAVICDRGTPSHRFVEEAEFGVVVSPNCTANELRNAYLKCRELIENKNSEKVSIYFRDKYGWPAITEQVLKALEDRQKPKIFYQYLKKYG
jgi:glycosyltransferase involved in cell wall biosynthesis